MGFTVGSRCSGLDITLHEPRKHHTSDRLFAIDSLQLGNLSEYFCQYHVLGLMIYGLWHIPDRGRILETKGDLRCFDVQVPGSIRESPLKSKI